MIVKENYLDALKNKEIDALKYMIDTYSNLIFKVAYSILNDREHSEECINDVFMKVWNNVKSFDKEEDKFKNWICTITKYNAIDILRREKKYKDNINLEDTIVEDKNNLEKEVEVNNDVEIIRKEINSMGEPDREIFIRRFYYGEKIKDICIKLGLTENAVNLRILRGRKRLSQKIEEGYNG